MFATSSPSPFVPKSGGLPKRLLAAFAAAAGLAAAMGLTAASARAETYELRIADFVAPTHPINVFFEKWAQEMEEASDGQLKFTIYPSAQLGPAPRYFDIARRGQADITWVLHGSLPSRFPLAEISNLPFLFCSGEQASKVLNDPELREKYLDAEHDGVKVLNIHATVPGDLWTAGTKVENTGDMAGLAIRPASRTIGAYVSALGASPLGLAPNELAEAMEKGTADGGFMDYPAGAYSFQIGAVSDYITELNAYVTSFSIVMNEDSYNKLPADLQELITSSLEDRAGEIGSGWDNLVAPAKADLEAAGVEIFQPGDEDYAQFRAIGEQVSDEWVAGLDEKGLPATEVYQMMEELAAKYADSSADFCR